MIGILVSLVCLILFGADSFMIPTMILIVLLLTLLRKWLEQCDKLKEKEELSTTLLSIQSEYDSCVADCKELTEREELINFIEDHATVLSALGSNS